MVGQFAASIILIAGTMVVYRQMDYMRRQNLGADIDRTLVLKGAAGGLSDSVYREGLQAFKNDARELSGVKTVTVSSNVPGEENLWSYDWEWQNNPNGERKEETMMLGIDYDFIPAYDIKVIAGRNFFRDIPYDRWSVLLNESAVHSLGFPSADSAIGQRVGNPAINLNRLLVVGVVADFHQEGLQKPIRPLVLWLDRDGGMSRVSIKMAGADPAGVTSAVKRVWERDYPDFPFSYFFLDDFFDRQYAETQRFGEIFGLFAIFAIGIACFGLLGLSAFNVLQRAREISIRKVLGASIPRLIYLLTADYFFLVGIAVVIAIPVTWIAMNKWLQGFAFRLPISWWIFGLAAIAALLVAGCTVGAQVWKAARANPVTNLNAE
jgi:putative ABC transport system permease protein